MKVTASNSKSGLHASGLGSDVGAGRGPGRTDVPLTPLRGKEMIQVKSLSRKVYNEKSLN